MGRPKRRQLGQNFLIDPQVTKRIAALTKTNPTRVLEIGPGRGALTGALLERFDRVLALEVDTGLIPSLQENFAGTALEIRSSDALKEPLDPLLAAEKPWQVAANLPYSVGTAILRRLLPRHDLITRIVVMLQSEVVDRLVAEPSGSGHGLLALERAAYAEATMAFDVPPGAFRPQPKVHSTVAVIDLKPPRFSEEELQGAFRLASHGLNRARKTLPNALKPLVDLDQIERGGLDPGARPGTLDLADWVRLARSTDPR
ncbi:MAG: 16S rRNA (adenine(1518)-N(6)/adenine(1519)-N(6))-dimethyltransferase RsmA [Acidobacteriota bacterium]